jgi:hypothetical protein
MPKMASPNPARQWAVSIIFIAFSYLSMSYILGNAWNNGYFKLNETLDQDGVRLLPGPARDPSPTRFTGIEALDYTLVDFIRFFWSIITVDHPALTIFSVYMTGQVLGLNVVMAIEGVRAGNAGTLIA